MLADCRILGLIPARGGSVALPRKNVRPLAGKPLVAWTITAALESEYLDRVVLSSDDDEIMKVARTWGCEVPFRRPNHLATAEAAAIDVVLHALEELPGFDYVVLLQPTSPLRIAPDIDGAIEKCMAECAPSCVSVVRVEKSLRWMYHLSDNQRMLPVVAGDEIPSRRQDDRATYALNGAVYVAQVNELRRQRQFITEGTVAYAMPPERSPDIDTELDLHWCEFLLRRQSEPDGKITGGAR